MPAVMPDSKPLTCRTGDSTVCWTFSVVSSTRSMARVVISSARMTCSRTRSMTSFTVASTRSRLARVVVVACATLSRIKLTFGPELSNRLFAWSCRCLMFSITGLACSRTGYRRASASDFAISICATNLRMLKYMAPRKNICSTTAAAVIAITMVSLSSILLLAFRDLDACGHTIMDWWVRWRSLRQWLHDTPAVQPDRPNGPDRAAGLDTRGPCPPKCLPARVLSGHVRAPRHCRPRQLAGCVPGSRHRIWEHTEYPRLRQFPGLPET